MTQDTQIAIRISAAALARLDDLRRAEPDLPSRAEMIRRLIERAEVAPAEMALAIAGKKMPILPPGFGEKAVAKRKSKGRA